VTCGWLLAPAVEFDDAVQSQSGSPSRLRVHKTAHSKISCGPITGWVLPVGRCFTLQTFVLVFFPVPPFSARRLGSDREPATRFYGRPRNGRKFVGVPSSPKTNDWFLLHGRLLVLVAQRCLPAAGGCAPPHLDKRCVAFAA